MRHILDLDWLAWRAVGGLRRGIDHALEDVRRGVAHQFGLDAAGMKGGHGDVAVRESLVEFEREEHIGGLGAAVGLGRIVFGGLEIGQGGRPSN